MGFYITDETQDRGPRAAAPPWGPKPARGPIREVISGYRFYNPDLGRWVSRDPIEEEEGFEMLYYDGLGETHKYGIYLFNSNNPASLVDKLGLMTACSVNLFIGHSYNVWNFVPQDRKKYCWTEFYGALACNANNINDQIPVNNQIFPMPRVSGSWPGLVDKDNPTKDEMIGILRDLRDAWCAALGRLIDGCTIACDPCLPERECSKMSFNFNYDEAGSNNIDLAREYMDNNKNDPEIQAIFATGCTLLDYSPTVESQYWGDGLPDLNAPISIDCDNIREEHDEYFDN